MSLLPPTNSKSLAAAVCSVCAGIVYLYFMQLCYTKDALCIAVETMFMLPAAVGLWFMKEAARRVVSGSIMFLVFVLPVGVFHPFATADLEPPFPELWPIIVKVYLLVALGLLIVHILGKHKHEFTPLFKQHE